MVVTKVFTTLNARFVEGFFLRS